MYRDEELQRAVVQAADEAQALIEMPGWNDMAQWMAEEIRLSHDALERGVGSWDDYQRTVGRIRALRDVSNRPAHLVEEGKRVVTGDYDDE